MMSLCKVKFQLVQLLRVGKNDRQVKVLLTIEDLKEMHKKARYNGSTFVVEFY